MDNIILPVLPQLPYASPEQMDLMNKALQTIFIQSAYNNNLPECFARITHMIDSFNKGGKILSAWGIDSQLFDKAKNTCVHLKNLIQIKMQTHLLN